MSYDRYHEKANQIYRIINAGTIRDNQIEMPLVSGPWGPAMVEEIPEVLKAVRIKPPDSRWVIEHGERKYNEKGLYFVDPTFFEVFEVEMVAGDPETALNEPFSMVITEEMAEKYFREEDPIGNVIVGDNWMNFNQNCCIFKGGKMSDKKIVQSRRNFIRNGLTGLTGAMLAPSVTRGDRKPLDLQNKDRKFI